MGKPDNLNLLIMTLSIHSYAIGLNKENANKETEVDTEIEAGDYIENRIAEIEDDENNNEADKQFFIKNADGNEVNVF